MLACTATMHALPSQLLVAFLSGSWAEPWRLCFPLPFRCRYYSSLRLPLMYSHPYSQITVETEFDNPIYETGVSCRLFSAKLAGG